MFGRPNAFVRDFGVSRSVVSEVPLVLYNLFLRYADVFVKSFLVCFSFVYFSRIYYY